ncbi:LpqB family beta-propeller domain-containing protein [Nocardiopsis sp. L17-MgMaSL7]|uniref:LpqB family beta-propeller domain-containing protein n=1 Tax=Nocardiopsis sp. L17-MgMaSL7 TaxID=1938893 RepID=UPI000D71ACC6|nr:LpqB family beta-propeller domain-containing protein [Nocardiopsis sp. L17-MgMaSL7]PWV50056.1 sporulation and spore germination protein [Nocardiopsis sp. L17-MgMaSL7]
MSDVERPGRLARAARSIAAGTLACVSLAACASVPMTGPVVPSEGGDGSGDPYGGYVRLLPAGPQPGVEPEGLIDGFLKDLGSFEEDHKAARSYMLPEQSEEWTPDAAVRVFSDLDAVDMDSEVSSDGLSATVRIRSNEIASIDESGKYVPAETGTMLEETFTLAKEGDDPEGEWRIQDLPDEIILSQLDVERTYRPFNLYFFNPAGTALVPDPVYLPVSTDQLAERLLRKLIGGPTDWLAPAVLSAFPEGTAPRLEIDAERAVININGQNEADEYGMGAQIAWTLRQLPEIQEFTLRINGEEVSFPQSDGDSSDRPRPGSDYWSRVSPGATFSGVHAYYTHEGQLWSAADWDADNFNDAERVAGPLGAGEVRLDRFAVSLDESTIAGITLGGREVVTSFASPGAQTQEVLSDGVFTELSWDVNGDLWVVEETGDGSRPDDEDDEEDAPRADEEPGTQGSAEEDPPAPGDTALWLLRDGDEVVQAEVRGLRDQSLVHFRISRDGARAAVVTERDGERSLQVGRVVENEDGQVSVGAFISLADQELEDITSIAWRSSDQLVVLGSRDGGTTQALFVSLDGGTPAASAGAPVAGMISISGAPGQPLLAGSDDGNIWVSNDPLNWQNVVEGGSPTFPG